MKMIKKNVQCTTKPGFLEIWENTKHTHSNTKWMNENRKFRNEIQSKKKFFLVSFSYCCCFLFFRLLTIGNKKKIISHNNDRDNVVVVVVGKRKCLKVEPKKREKNNHIVIVIRFVRLMNHNNFLLIPWNISYFLIEFRKNFSSKKNKTKKQLLDWCSICHFCWSND